MSARLWPALTHACANHWQLGGRSPIFGLIVEIETMSAVAFDTLKFVERLEAGGFSHAQAKAAAQAFADAISEQIATKGDLGQTKLELEAKIEGAKADILKWMFGQTLIILGAVFAMARVGHL